VNAYAGDFRRQEAGAPKVLWQAPIYKM
jgi:hypothetical protein